MKLLYHYMNAFPENIIEKISTTTKVVTATKYQRNKGGDDEEQDEIANNKNL